MAFYSFRCECVCAGVKEEKCHYDFDSDRMIPRTNVHSPDTRPQRSTIQTSIIIIVVAVARGSVSLSFRCGQDVLQNHALA